MTEPVDVPYLLGEGQEQRRRAELLTLPHIKPLADFVASVRAAIGAECHVPDFDPCDGGVNARVLSLLEAPGPKAKASGFVSSNNPDPTAKNLWNLIHNAGIARADTLIWNIVPWYVGENGHIKPAPREDIKQALPYLKLLLGLLPGLELVVLVGLKARSAEPQIRLLTALPICRTFHMSARVFHRWPDKKKQTEEKFGEIGAFLQGPKAGH